MAQSGQENSSPAELIFRRRPPCKEPRQIPRFSQSCLIEWGLWCDHKISFFRQMRREIGRGFNKASDFVKPCGRSKCWLNLDKIRCNIKMPRFSRRRFSR